MDYHFNNSLCKSGLMKVYRGTTVPLKVACEGIYLQSDSKQSWLKWQMYLWDKLLLFKGYCYVTHLPIMSRSQIPFC